MTKQMAKDIAHALVAKSGEQFDSFSFDEVELSEKDKNKILDEIHQLCEKMIDRVESKYGVTLGNTTKKVTESIHSKTRKK